jgi:hypothetical protein
MKMRNNIKVNFKSIGCHNLDSAQQAEQSQLADSFEYENEPVSYVKFGKQHNILEM